MIGRCRNCGARFDGLGDRNWNSICSACEQLTWLLPGDVVDCRVIRLARFGVFVELGDGVEGLIHITELDDLPVRFPEEVVQVGSRFPAKVLRVDLDERKIGLSRKRAEWTES